MQNFGMSDHSERNGAQNSKKDQNLPILAMLDLPYLNTTKVSFQVKYENLLYSTCILVLQMQNFGMLDHSEKMELKIRKMTDICLYRPCWICHILIQQRPIIKSTLKIYSLASLFCCCICKILACCIVEKKMKLKIRKMTEIYLYWPSLICHVLIQQRSVVK